MRSRAVAWALLVVTITGALWLRASRLSALGFAEDEIDIPHALLAALAARPPAREWLVRGATAVRLYGPSSPRPCAPRGGTLSALR